MDISVERELENFLGSPWNRINKCKMLSASLIQHVVPLHM